MLSLISGSCVEVKITGVRWVTSQSGTRGLRVETEYVENGEIQDICGTIWYTPRTLGMFRRQLRALGVDIDQVHLRDVEETIELGQMCKVRLDEYKGEIKIGFFGDSVESTPPPAEELDTMTTTLRAAASEKRKVATAKKKEPEEDIPF